jgi:NitT/TauT family transport system substrate-binding protein
MANGAGKPKPAFFIAVAIVVLGLCGIAFWRCTKKKSAEEGKPQAGSNITLPSQNAEDPNNSGGTTTVKEYTFEPAQKLPKIDSADLKPLGKDRTVKFAINVWAGWAPIIYANGGMKAGKLWKDAKGGEFKVELKLVDNPVNMATVYAAGEVQIGWATVDMLPLVLQRLQGDKRSMPGVFQQIDWSIGGDGIVSRENIGSVNDLRGKTVALAQNSPSHFFLLNVLLNAGVQPWEVDMKFTPDAFQAAAAYKADKNITACVSWSPDIYTLTTDAKGQPIKGNKLLISTGTANKLIADVWFARSDFAQANPEIIEGLVRGILDSVTELKDDKAKEQAATLLDAAYDLPPGTGKSMLGDAHWANYAENADFFLNQNNPTNFERTYNTAYLLYKQINQVESKVPFDQIMDFSVIKALGKEEKYANQKNEYQYQFTPASSETVSVESAVLTKTVVINFFPNSYDLDKQVDGKPYDPNAKYMIEEIGKLAGQFGAARIQIEGHTDASMKGVADERLVRELSLQRANAVKQAVLNKFPKLDQNQFGATGWGWDRPADPNDPENHAKNRRVEVKVIPAEAQ